MKFFCEYCGARINADVNDNCPKCGASYKKNKTFIELENKRKQEQDQSKEFQNQIFNQVINRMKFSKLFLIFPIIVFIIIAIISILSFNNNSHISILNLNSKDEESVTVNLNEYGSTSKYKVKVIKYEFVEEGYGLNKLQSDQEYVKFYIMVENISKERLTHEKVNCIVDGVAQTNKFTSGYSDLPFFIEKGLTVQGTATFIVPKDAKSYDIRYGDYVTIHIEK